MKFRLLLLALLGASSYAQTGTFTRTGNLITGRVYHTATLLPNGKVLIVGGAYSNTAELYDPATEIFSRTGDMITQRTSGQVATVLNDGRVLIAGGSVAPVFSFHADYRLSNAELYDPSTGTFTATGDLPSPFARAVGIVLPGGKVFVDGSPLDGSAGGAAALYDPAAGSFAETGARLGSVCYPALGRLLTNGKILELVNDVYVDLNQYGCLYQNIKEPAELYDPATGAFSLTGQLPAAYPTCHGGPDVSLPDGIVLISGGDAVEFYDPASAAFTCSGPMQTPSRGHTSATLLADGRVLLAGGQDNSGNPIADTSAEIYSPPTLIAAPVLFSTAGDGKGQGAIWHAKTEQIASAENPAVAGEALSMYTTSLADGSVIPLQVIVGGRLARVLYFGAAPCYPGYYQVNFIVPDGVPPGPALSVRLTYIGRSSNAVTIGVQ